MTASPAVNATLQKMKSSDTTARMLAIGEAGTHLARGEEGALEPFVVIMKDDDMMIRMTALSLLARMMGDPSMKSAITNAVSAEGMDSEFVKTLKAVAESDAMEADDARGVLAKISA